MKNTNYIAVKTDEYIDKLSHNKNRKVSDKFAEIARGVKMRIYSEILEEPINSKGKIGEICDMVDEELFKKGGFMVTKGNYEMFKESIAYREKIKQEIEDHLDSPEEAENKRLSLYNDVELIFKKRITPDLMINEIIELIDKNDGDIDFYNISNILKNVGNIFISKDRFFLYKKNMDDLISKINECLKYSDVSTTMNGFNLKNALIGIESSYDISPEFFETLGNKILTSNYKYSADDIFQMMKGLRSSSGDSRNFLEIMISRLDPKFKLSSKDNIKKGIFGLEMHDHIPQNLIDFIYLNVKEIIGDCRNNDIRKMLQGLLNITRNNKENTTLKKIIYTLLGGIDARESELSGSKELIQLVKVISYYNHFISDKIILDEKIKEEYEEKKLHLEGDIVSDAEKYVYDQIRNRSNKVKMQNNSILDGIEMDFHFPDQKINLEIDGIQHIGKEGKDSLRDNYLQDKYGIQTFRISLEATSKFRENVKDFVAYII